MAAQDNQRAVAPGRRNLKRRMGLVSGTGVWVVLACVGYCGAFMRNKASTDDTYVRAEGAQISSRVSGSVQWVLVDDHDPVKAVQPLVELDPADYAAALACFVWVQLGTEHPVVDLRAFQDRSFSAGTFIVFCGFFCLFGGFVLLPLFLQNLMGYTAFWAGWVLGPGGLAAFLSISKERTGNASGIFNLMRNLGGGCGVAFATTMLARHSQLQQNALIGRLSPYPPAFQFYYENIRRWLHTQNPQLAASASALGAIYSMVLRQTSMLAFNDTFRMLCAAPALLIPVTLLFRPGQVDGREDLPL